MSEVQNIVELKLAMDTVWLTAAAALVFFMQAGFALLESGMSRAKNSVNVIMKNYTDMCFGSIAFWLVGYGLMFGANPTGWLGTDGFMFSSGEAMDYSLLFFQTMFAATAATIVGGAMAERTRYPAYIVASIVIMALIYPVYGSWVWGSAFDGEGWLAALGFIDFAGSTVVHSIGGWCALAGVLVLGPRLGRYGADGSLRDIAGHSLPLLALGGFILWLGWFGFNGGSTLAAEASIGGIVLNTHLAAAAGCVSAILTQVVWRQPVLVTHTVNGSIGGLVAITAGAASMAPEWALVTGAIGGFVVVLGTWLLNALRVDDVVGAVPVHGFCGVWGTLAAGLFLIDNPFSLSVFMVQLLGVIAAFMWAFPVALLVFWLISVTMGLRTDSLSEQRGLDYSEHYETGYPDFRGIQLHGGTGESPRGGV